jgi:hypothetical protein
MERLGRAEIMGSDLCCGPNKGFIRVLGFQPMGLPMISPYCDGCKIIYMKECNVEEG